MTTAKTSHTRHLTTAALALAGALVLTVFLLAGGDFYHRRIIEAMPRLRDKKQALTIIRDVERQISRYLGAIFLINAALGIAVGLSMWALSMPTPIVWGVLAFLRIPNAALTESGPSPTPEP